MHFAMTNGSESSTCFPEKPEMSVSPPEIIADSSKRFSTDTAPELRGVTCRSASAIRQGADDTIIGVKGLVGDQDVGGHLRQQCIGADQIVDLSWGEQKAQRVAERVDQGMDLGGQSALAAANGLIIIFFWVRRRCAGGPARWCCRSWRIRCRRRRPSAQTRAARSPSWPSG